MVVTLALSIMWLPLFPSEVTLKDMVKCDCYQSTTKHNKSLAMHTILGTVYCMQYHVKIHVALDILHQDLTVMISFQLLGHPEFYRLAWKTRCEKEACLRIPGVIIIYSAAREVRTLPITVTINYSLTIDLSLSSLWFITWVNIFMILFFLCNEKFF